MKIRNASSNDLESIYKIEIACFPPNQAASMEAFSNRLKVYPQHFWLIEDGEEILGFINGMVTDRETIADEMFKNPELHFEDGKWQSVFGLAVSPNHQNKGYAGKLLNHLAEVARQQNRKGIILTCEEDLIPYYEKFGFVNSGLSDSAHGGDVFYDMKKRL
ncbi:GNAT family N-acetyltransferase [Flavobacterium sp. 3HN19-14]|uniref:GNAT family N-acetyltransferase n=1 Tax=Flavobacterium sp. 3HN19-14 TaxID=3448133 RepID=UPI003EE13592